MDDARNVMKSSVIIGRHLATSKSISSPSVSKKYSTSSACVLGGLRACHRQTSVDYYHILPLSQRC